MPPAFPTSDDAFSHPSGELSVSSHESPSLEKVLLGYAQGLDCTLNLNNLWDAIDAQLDVDSQAHQTGQQFQHQPQQADLLAKNDETNTLWDTYADSPECLEPETCQQLESVLPHWPQAQHAIGERQALIAALRHYAQRTEAACTFVANLQAVLNAPPVKPAIFKPLPQWAPLWAKTVVAIASVAALWVLMLDPSALIATTGAIASSGAMQPDRSLLATASAPSVEAYVMTYCDDTSLTAASLPNTDEMLDSSQVVLMGCGSVN